MKEKRKSKLVIMGSVILVTFSLGWNWVKNKRRQGLEEIGK